MNLDIRNLMTGPNLALLGVAVLLLAAMGLLALSFRGSVQIS